jgi:hypothetical protein
VPLQAAWGKTSIQAVNALLVLRRTAANLVDAEKARDCVAAEARASATEDCQERRGRNCSPGYAFELSPGALNGVQPADAAHFP